MVRDVVVMVFFTDCDHFFNHKGHRVKSTENTKEFYKKVSRKDTISFGNQLRLSVFA
jgi:hypothetical protein